MFSSGGCRRGFPREPALRQDGPWPPCAHGPPDVWDLPPWEHQHRRGGGRWHPPGPWDPRPLPGPAEFPWSDEDRRCAPHDRPLPPPWDDRDDVRGREECLGECWQPPGPRDPRRFPGPADFPWKEENGRWVPLDPRTLPGPADFPWGDEDRRCAPHDRPPPPLWDDRGDSQGREECLGERWHLEPPLPVPGRFVWPEFPDEKPHPPCPPSSMLEEQGSFQEGSLSWGYSGLGGKRCRRLRRSRRELTLVQRLPCLWPSRGNQPTSRSSLSGTSQPGLKEELQRHDPSKPLPSFKDGGQSREQTAQGPLTVSRNVLEPPRRASTPQKSPATDPGAATEAAEPEEAAGATPVEPAAGQKPAGSHSQDSSASETGPAPPEESSAGTGQHLEARQRGAGEAEAEAAGDALLGGLQPSENSQIPPGATAEPDAQPSQPGSSVCTVPATSPETQPPPGSGETETAEGSQRRLCSALPMFSPDNMALRSAAVLARKEEIELSYQQFSLTIAVVATMLLQKEPSMEAALGLALRANLRQGRIHHLQELEDFINSYDSATLIL